MNNLPFRGETNPLEDPRGYHVEFTARDCGYPVRWDDPSLKRIIRLRLLSDPGYPVWDVSYCYGMLGDGRTCRVELPFDRLPKKGARHAIVRHAKRDGVFAKGLGIFEAISTLV